MNGVRDAIDLVVAGVAVLPAEAVPLRDALGRVLAESVDSPITVPAHTNSAMDGFAVRADDVRGAARGTPRRLTVVEEVRAGALPTRRIGPGEATRVFTGAPLPEGADGVIRQEDTTLAGPVVEVLDDRDAGRNVRFAGEDLRRGARVLEAGTPLGPAHLGVLASMARAIVRVRRRARVGILASGDEIADLDETEAILAGRKTASSNSYTLDALVRLAGAVPVPLGIAADTPASVREKLEQGFATCDLVVSTAGLSVGAYDYLRAVLEELGCRMLVSKVRMRPGSPTAFGTVRGVPWLGLPGNPVSTMVCFELFVRPAVLKMQGHTLLHRRVVRATLDEPVTTPGRLTHFLRAVARESAEGWRARLTGPQGSGILTSMTRANALLIVPEGVDELPAGATVEAMLLEHESMVAEPPVRGEK
ncbi:MAG TPA: gephyrin-like molybdotransferase Glp [Gemmatimonadales bacterium]|nr:gephyrin-like molybdotransferase Glp [Gemmatimonadales bacterium]